MPTTPETPTPTPIDFATCPCGALTFTLLKHRIVCPECGAGIDVPELDLIKLVNDANTDDSAPFPAHN